MKRWLIAGLLLNFMVLFVAPAAPKEQGPRGPLLFNPQAIETVQGIVVEAPAVKKGGIPEMQHLTLKTDKEKLTLILGPNWYMARQGWKIAPLDHIEATGSRLDLDGKPALITQEVKKGEQVMQFRDQSGKPRWAASPPQTP